MMVTMQGEDSMIFAEAKGLKDSTLFVRYAMRNALLPQTTALALALGEILSGAVLVEVVFGYPGIGSVLYNAIKDFDYYLIQGIVFTIVLSIGFMTLLVDLTYPLLDPRIRYGKSCSCFGMPGATPAATRTWCSASSCCSSCCCSASGRFFVDVSNADPLSVSPEKPPSWLYPFGTDSQGRDLLAVMVAGTPLTLRIGVIAGVIGLGVGTTLAFVSAFYGGAVDAVIRSIVDISLTVPGLLVLILAAVFLKRA